MSDQATVLRGLMRRHALAGQQRAAAQPLGPRSLVVASGKGGVGKTHLALNAAVCLARAGRSVCLLDLNPGRGNIELLCGLNSYWNLKHLLTGGRSVADIALEGPAGVQVLTGAVELLDSPTRQPSSAQRHAWDQVKEYLRPFSHVIIDTISGDSPLVRKMMQIADMTWLVTTPELTSIADAYSIIKGCASETGWPPLELVVNRVDSMAQGLDVADRLKTTCQSFLQYELNYAGSVPHDLCVPQSTAQRRPFFLEAPQSSASLALEQLARGWGLRSTAPRSTFLSRFDETARRAA